MEPTKRLSLFVASPLGSTYTVRNLTQFTKLATFKTQLELVAGFPSGTYTLYYGQNAIADTEKLLFSGAVQSYCVLRIGVEPTLVDIVEGIKSKDNVRLLEALQSGGVELSGESAPETGKAFIAACLCSHIGYQTGVAALLEKCKLCFFYFNWLRRVDGIGVSNTARRPRTSRGRFGPM